MMSGPRHAAQHHINIEHVLVNIAQMQCISAHMYRLSSGTVQSTSNIIRYVST